METLADSVVDFLAYSGDFYRCGAQFLSCVLTEGFARLPSATVANSASKMLTAFTLHVLQ